MVNITLYELQLNHQLCDATIHLEDGGEFPVHRFILSSCSTFFKAFFLTTLHQPEKTDFALSVVSSSTMEIILEYAYLRNTEINEHNVCLLLITADYLSILGLLNKCCNFLQSRLSPKNCLGVMRFAKDNFCDVLAQDTQSYLMRHFVEVAEKSEEILVMNLNELLQVIKADELNVRTEEVVWECVLRWINFDPEVRKFHIVPLMKSIRLGLLETQFFLEKVKDHHFVLSNEECRPIVIETLKFLYDLEMITQKNGEVPTPEIARPRLPHEVLFAIGGWSGGSPTNIMETYDTRADRWIKVDEIDSQGPRAYHGTVVIGFNIYVIGGFDGMDYFNSCRCYNAAEKTWSEIAPMNARRCYVSVTVHRQLVYAMGGYDGHHRQNSAERYNYKTNQWSLIAPMNVQRSDASAATLHDKIYITGGFNGQECLNSIECYNPKMNQWTMLLSMRYRRSGVSCIAYHNCLYVIGGFNGMSRMCSGEKYNPQTKMWTPIPEMYNPRSNFAIAVIDDMIFAMGGFNGVSTIYHVECFDEQTNEWYEATDMNVYRSALSASVITGLPNVSDYIHQHRERLMEEKRQKLLALEQGNNMSDIHVNAQNQNEINVEVGLHIEDLDGN